MIEGMSIFDLEQPRTTAMPIHPAPRQAGYSYLLHRHHKDEYYPDEKGPRSGVAGLIICGEHTGTHIDALCHQRRISSFSVMFPSTKRSRARADSLGSA